MGVVGDAKLIWDSQQQGVGLGDGLVFPELLDEYVRLGSIATPEDRPGVLIDEADLVFVPPFASEIGTITIVHERKDAAADRYTRLARVPGLLPGCAVCPDLVGLLHMKRLA